MKKILITGANSYIGTSFENWVKQYGDMYIVDTISVRDDKWREKSFIGYDSVVHVAGIAHIKETHKNSQLYYKVNRDLAVEVAKKAKKDGVKQFVFLSSMSVYGIDKGVITKDTIPTPKSNYGKSKLEAEKKLNELSNETFKVSILRPPMVYGKDCKGNYQTLSKYAANIPVFPQKNNRRSMIYIDHLSEFIRLIINKEISGILCPQDKQYVCTSEMVRVIAEVRGNKIKLVKLFNPIINILKINIINKVFGDLVYEFDTYIEEDYCSFNFKDTIIKSEGLYE